MDEKLDGLVQRVDESWLLLAGNGKMGVSQKVNVMWKLGIWVAGSPFLAFAGGAMVGVWAFAKYVL